MKLVVFAKAPIPGQAKTRLAAALGPSGAAELHRRLVCHTLEKSLAADIGPVELCCAPDAGHGFFADCVARYGVALGVQGDGDLGARMSRVFERDAPAVLIGCDAPSLTASDIRAAARALDAADGAMTPAEDGGYMLIALRAAAPALFTGIAWSTADVARETRGRAASLGFALHDLPMRWDVDRPADLARLAEIEPALLEGLR